MTQESIISNHVDDVSPSGSAYSSGEIYRMTLEENGDLFMENNGDLRGIANGDVLDRVDSGSLIINSPGTHLGTKVMIKVDGPTTFVTGGNKCLENGEFANDQVTNPEPPLPSKPNRLKTIKRFLKDRPTQIWLAGIVLSVMSIGSLATFFGLFYYGQNVAKDPTFGHHDNLGDDIQVIQREEWSAREPLRVDKVEGPFDLVRILHTAGSNCLDSRTCTRKVLALQGWQISTLGMPDIAYNYLIGGDGNVYVGRGPDVKCQWRNDSMDIVFIGNFLSPYDKVTDKMDQAGRRMIARLAQQGYLREDYKVIAHNQTFFTQSPGENVYERIVKWPHYDSGLYY